MRRALPLPPLRDPRSEALRRAVQADERADRSARDADRTPVFNSEGSEDIGIATTAEVVLYHHLGRQPQGWRQNDLASTTGSAVSAPLSRVAWDAETITIRNNASVPVTCRLEVF